MEKKIKRRKPPLSHFWIEGPLFFFPSPLFSLSLLAQLPPPPSTARPARWPSSFLPSFPPSSFASAHRSVARSTRPTPRTYAHPHAPLLSPSRCDPGPTRQLAPLSFSTFLSSLTLLSFLRLVEGAAMHGKPPVHRAHLESSRNHCAPLSTIYATPTRL